MSNDNIHWAGRDLGNDDAIMYYRGRLHIDSIRGSPYLSDLPGSPLLDEVLRSDDYEVEIRVIRRLSQKKGPTVETSQERATRPRGKNTTSDALKILAGISGNDPKILKLMTEEGRRLDAASKRRLAAEEEVYKRAAKVLGSESAARDWMHAEQTALGKKPRDMLDRPAGRKRILKALGAIEKGVYLGAAAGERHPSPG